MLRKILKEEKGTALVLTAIAVVALCGFAAISIDIGNLYLVHTELSNAVDAAALAGAQELPASAELANAQAAEYAQRNGIELANLGTGVSDDHRIIRVTGSRTVDYYFAKVLGFQRKTLTARSAAKVGAVKSVNKGIVPFGVVKQTFIPGEQYTLKLGAGTGANGNFGALALGGTGADNYRDNVKYGYNNELQANDWVVLETGDMSGPTRQGVGYRIGKCPHYPMCTAQQFDPDCPRVTIVPVIDSLEDNGRGDVQIIGFAAFFLENVAGNGNECYVTGRFVQKIYDGEIDDNLFDYSLIGVKLIE